PSPEASIRWLDYFYSEEGGAYLDQGPEGDLWEWNEDETKRVDKEDDDIPDQYDDTEDYRASITPAFGIAAPYLVQDIEKEEPSETDGSSFSISCTRYGAAIPNAGVIDAR